MNTAVLVDRDVARARVLASRFSAARVEDRFERIQEDIDAAVIATPPSLHYEIAMPLLARGVHVLCEKPLAESLDDATAMVEQAKRSGACLCVNLTRRAFPAFRRVKELLASGAIGDCTTIEHAEGARFTWKTASGWHFTQPSASRQSRGGVLLDQGAHVLDTICWWLGDKPTVASCVTDSFGGPEGVASLVLRRGTCMVKVKLSWLSKLSNTYRITGTRGVIAGGVYDWRLLTITSERGDRRQLKVSSDRASYLEFGHTIIDNFLDVLRGREAPLVPAASVLAPIQLIEECYSRASRIPMPWVTALPSLKAPELAL